MDKLEVHLCCHKPTVFNSQLFQTHTCCLAKKQLDGYSVSHLLIWEKLHLLRLFW